MDHKEPFLIMDTRRTNDRQGQRTEKHWENRAPSTRTRWFIILGMLIFVAAIFGGGYAYEQSLDMSDLKIHTQSIHSDSDASPTSPSYSTLTAPSTAAASSQGQQFPLESAQ